VKVEDSSTGLLQKVMLLITVATCSGD